MKNLYLALAIIGFILPNIFVLKVGIETGNILLWTDIPTTLNSMFANDIASAFMTDLFYMVLLFMIWSYQEAKKYKIANYWVTWILTFLFGIAGGFPLFLYLKSKAETL
ncbi:DUF2834 domain-containing protein [Aureispira anguillae]|uniref:DUF2834 domain-containing protein n=1 Tax=Aureispira anguillae TaxID=2864201 RepID=A0A915YDJ2_9BACT|nr:DUF2834 domain-containing protein [Aureispira anguillae]BDS11098.1 DUF2834 domain-containing protein [Aureispira anguillae]